jgi:uncharacterized protein HemX
MSVGTRPPGVQRPVNIGPYIISAAFLHAIVLVAGMFFFVEYQKAQVKSEVERVKTEFNTRVNEQKQRSAQFDEPADRRGK